MSNGKRLIFTAIAVGLVGIATGVFLVGGLAAIPARSTTVLR